MHPDRQKEIMIAQAEYEMNKEVLVIDFQKIEYYTTKASIINYFLTLTYFNYFFSGYCTINNTPISR